MPMRPDQVWESIFASTTKGMTVRQAPSLPRTIPYVCPRCCEQGIRVVPDASTDEVLIKCCVCGHLFWWCEVGEEDE